MKQKILCLMIILFLLCGNGFAFEIYALGTSATNCKGVDRDKIFPVKLQEILRAAGFDATVVNGGEDGDKPIWMFRRLPKAINPDTRLVIFEPGPNESNKSSYIEYAEKILAFLKEHHLPTIYASSGSLQTTEEALETAKKYDAYYYGPFRKGVPIDNAHFQFDSNQGGKGPGGHMKAEGCEIVAKTMAPLIEQILTEKNIH